MWKGAIAVDLNWCFRVSSSRRAPGKSLNDTFDHILSWRRSKVTKESFRLKAPHSAENLSLRSDEVTLDEVVPLMAWRVSCGSVRSSPQFKPLFTATSIFRDWNIIMEKKSSLKLSSGWYGSRFPSPPTFPELPRGRQSLLNSQEHFICCPPVEATPPPPYLAFNQSGFWLSGVEYLDNSKLESFSVLFSCKSLENWSKDNLFFIHSFNR